MSLEERMASIEVRVREIDREVNRSRDRIHALEGDRAVLALLTKQGENMQAQMDGLRKAVDGLRRVLLGFAFTVAGGVTVFAFTIFTAFR